MSYIHKVHHKYIALHISILGFYDYHEIAIHLLSFASIFDWLNFGMGQQERKEEGGTQ